MKQIVDDGCIFTQLQLFFLVNLMQEMDHPSFGLQIRNNFFSEQFSNGWKLSDRCIHNMTRRYGRQYHAVISNDISLIKSPSSFLQFVYKKQWTENHTYMRECHIHLISMAGKTNSPRFMKIFMNSIVSFFFYSNDCLNLR